MSLTGSITAAVPHQTYIAMANTTSILAQEGEGTSQISQTLDNVKNFLFIIAGSLIGIAFVVAGVMFFFGSGNNFREKLGRVFGICIGCVVIGGGSAIGGAMIAVGQEMTG